jgi:hypothetical protein
VQDLFFQGPFGILPIDNTQISVVDQHQDIVPGGTVEAVIPLDNINSLPQVLASLQASLPISGTVLVPEPRNEIRPETVLRELDISNILGSNVATPVRVTDSRLSDASLTDRISNQRGAPVSSQINLPGRTEIFNAGRPQTRAISSSNANRQFVEPTRSPRQPHTSVNRRTFTVSRPQVIGLINVLGQDTVRSLFQTGRLRYQPNIQRSQTTGSPIIRSMAPSLTDSVMNQRRTVLPAHNNQIVPSFRQPNLADRRGHSMRDISDQTQRGSNIGSGINNDILSLLGL